MRNRFLAAYLEAALWSSTDEDGEPLDREYTADDFAPEFIARSVAECASFQALHGQDIETGCNRGTGEYSTEEQAGHDFWLTRCGHGAGFWDGDWEDEAGERMTETSKRFGNIDLYIGDDGLIYGA